MKSFTPKTWLTSILAMLMFAVCGSAKAGAIDFVDSKTITFHVTSLNGNYDVPLSNELVASGMSNALADNPQLRLADASGSLVSGANVYADLNDNVLTFTVSGAPAVTSGSYTIAVPEGTLYWFDMPNYYSAAFDVVLSFDNVTPVDPVDPTDPTDPDVPTNVTATFTLNNHVGSTSQYFFTGDVINSDVAGVNLTFDECLMENSKYSYCYKSNGGYLQLKGTTFTISAPEGKKITKIVFENGAPNSFTYALSNINCDGYEEGEWNGNAASVTFNASTIRVPIYSYDEDTDEEYISGYTETTSPGARVSKITVTLDEEAVVDPEPVDPTDPTDPTDPDITNPTDPDPVDPVDPDPVDPVDPDPVDPVDPDPVDPVDPDPVDPIADNVALFDFTHSIVYNVKDVTLTIDGSRSEWNEYFEAFQLYARSSENGDINETATFTAPEGKVITNVRIVESPEATNHGLYSMIANFEDDKWEVDANDYYSEATFTGEAQSISFTAHTTSLIMQKVYVTFDEPSYDGINSVLAAPAADSIYDLSGRRVKAASGLYIVDGKKVIR